MRAGFVARGVTYAIIGGIAVALALGFGSGAGTANQQGALALIAAAPLGRVVVGAAALGLLAYAAWKLGHAVFGTGPEGGGESAWRDRVSSLAAALIYLAFFGVAVRVLFGSVGNETTEQRQATGGVLGWPGGRVLVAGVGVALIVISVVQIYEALCDKFAAENKLVDMSDRCTRTFLALGHVGLCARAMVFVLVGFFFVRTAVEFKPSRGIGLDGALAAVRHGPFGPELLAVVALGLLIFAAFSMFEARYRRL